MKYVIITCILSIILSSCQKIIDIKLNTSSSQIVINGSLKVYQFYQTDPNVISTYAAVNVSRSVNFSDPNVFPQVSGATIIISDNAGNRDTLIEDQLEEGKGYYTNYKTIKGVEGRTYTLNVLVDGINYTAKSTLPKGVNIDSIYFGAVTGLGIFGPGNNNIELNISFKDPAGIANYYRCIVNVHNGPSSIKITSDNLRDGQVITQSFQIQDLMPNDRVDITLESIDASAYEYYRTEGRSNIVSSSPTNPTSNINNNALGYFSACSVRQKTIIFQ